MLDLTKTLEATGKSERQLGRDILAAWKRLERSRTKFPTDATIGAKLGLLRRQDTTWWTNQRRALDALAEVLGCRADEIVARDDSTPGAVPIAAFTELAPILPGQDACQLCDDGSWLGSLTDTVLHQEPRAWIVAPAGSGKSLAVSVLRQRHGGRVRVLSCRRLVDALPSESTAALPLVAEIAEPDDDTDEAALKEISKAPVNVCILAPFYRHIVRDAARSPWRDLRWAPSATDWRERLVKWAHARAPTPEEIDVEEIMGFVNALDPHGQLFTTPEDVLRVAARAFRSGLPKGPHALVDLARESLGRLFSSGESTWARTFGVAAVVALIERRLISTERSAGALRLDEWATLLPPDLAPTTPPNPPERKRRPLPESVPSTRAIRGLAEVDVLRATVDGNFDFAPWVRAAIERETVGVQLKRADLGWALWAVEPARRIVVDDALDAARPSALVQLVGTAIAADRSDLKTVAAIEALFAALARRLAGGWQPAPEMVGDLQKLGLRQLELVQSLPQDHRFPGSAPLTRRASAPSRDCVTAWIGEAWSFSFAVPAPKKRVASDWILPGWAASLRIADAPEGLPFADEDVRVRTAARHVLKACSDDALPERIAPCLIPWVIIDGPGRGWTLTKQVQSALFGTTGVAQVVADLLGLEPGAIRAQGARSAWDAALALSGGIPVHALGLLARASRDLRRVVLDNLPTEAFAASVRAEHPLTGEEGKLLSAIPARPRHRERADSLGRGGSRSPSPVRRPRLRAGLRRRSSCLGARTREGA